MKIFGVPFSVHTRKVIVAAKLKSLAYEVVPVVPVIPDNPPPNWRGISPTGLIPAIDDDGFVLSDSTAIVVYLDRRVPTPRLLPEDARDLARALALDAWAGSELFRAVIHPLFHQRVVAPRIRRVPSDRAAIEAAVSRSASALAYLEALEPRAALVGGDTSIADLSVVSNLVMLHYLGQPIDASRHPMLARYFAEQIRKPAFVAALADEPALVEPLGLDASLPTNR